MHSRNKMCEQTAEEHATLPVPQPPRAHLHKEGMPAGKLSDGQHPNQHRVVGGPQLRGTGAGGRSGLARDGSSC